MKKTLALLALLVVAALAILLLFAGEDPDGIDVAGAQAPSANALPPVDVDAEEPAAPETNAAEPKTDPEPSKTPTPPAAMKAKPKAEDEAPEPAAEDGTRLYGSVVVTDAQGAQHRSVDGEFTLVLWEGSGGVHHKVQVRGGQFDTLISPDRTFDRLTFDTMTMAGTRARPTRPTGRFDPPRDGRLDIEAAWTRPTVLIVRGADTGLELEDVQVVRAEDWKNSDNQHPGTQTKTVALGASPLRISNEKLQDRSELHVGASGYAWRNVELDFSHGGERIVTLERGAGLHVQLTGTPPPSSAQLRIYVDDEGGRRPLSMLQVGDALEFTLSGLLPGTYPVAVELGDWFQDPVSLGEATATLTAGETTRVELALRPKPTVETAGASGELIIPAEWGKLRLMLHADALKGDLRRKLELTEDEDRPGVHAWRLNDVPTGRYEFELFEPRQLWLIEVPAGGVERVRLELPPPAEVVVRVVDATGQDVRIPRLSWHPKLPEGINGWSSEDARRDPDTGQFTFKAPQGEIFLSHFGGGFRLEQTTLTVRPGVNTHTLVAKRTCGFVLRVRDGETLIPWSFDWKLDVKAVEGDGNAQGWGSEGSGHRVTVSEPGTYTVTLPEIDGFDPVPPQRINVPAGSYPELVIQLQRR